MAQMVSFRTDDDSDRALAVLTADGTPVSAAIRGALLEAAERRAMHRLREEAAELAADASDRAASAQVLRDLETLRAW